MAEENKEADKKENDSLSRAVDWAFNNKTIVILILIFLLGITLRYFAAIGVEPNADEMVHGPHASGIISSGVIGRVWQSVLWSYMTDLFQIIFGISMFSTRFLSFLFGSLSIIMVFLIARELFNKRTAIIASFLLAISSYHAIYTLIEMDIAAIFFILMASLFFIKKLKSEGKISYISAVLLGVAVLIKTLALFFVPVFLIGYWMHRKKVFRKEEIISVVKFGLIILLIFSPIIIHNYLWYKDSKMVDAYLAQYFDVGKSREVYSTIQGINQGFKVGEMIKGSWEISKYYLKIDPLNLIIGIIALLFFMYRKDKFSVFFFLFQSIPFLLLVYTNRLTTHFAIFPPIFAIYSAGLIDWLSSRYSHKIKPRTIISVFLIIFTIASLYSAWPYITQKSAVASMRSYVNSNVEDSSIVIADARIYRGRIAWMFLDRHYLESSYLGEIFKANEQLPGQNIPQKVYLIECVIDDCGWGTVSDEMNGSVEQMLDSLKLNMQLEKTIYGRREGTRDSSELYFNIYSATTSLKPGILDIIDSTHSFFYYPERYAPKSQVLDNYNVKGIMSNLLFFISKLIIWASLAIALIGIIYPFKMLEKKVKE